MSLKSKNKIGRSVYTFFFLSYITILLITISSLFVYYAKITQRVAIETQETKLALLNQLRESVEDKLEYADILYSDLVSNNKLTLLAKGYSSYSYKELLHDLEVKYLPDYMLNFSIYISDTNEIVTKGIRMDAIKYFSYMLQPQNMLYDEFEENALKSFHFKTIMPIMQIKAYGNSPERVLAYIRSFPPNKNEQTSGQFIFFINTKTIEALISELSSSTRSHIYIFDQNNNLMFCTDFAPLPTEYFKESLNNGSSMYEISMDKDIFMVTRKKSAANQWNYVISVPKKVYFQENAKFAVSFIVIFIVYLIMGLLIVRFLSKRSYKPVKEINDIIDDFYLNDNDNEKIMKTKSKIANKLRNKNEFQVIKNTILKQFEADQKLNDIIQAQMPIVRRDYLLSLIKGLETDYENAESKLSELGICIAAGQFLIAALEFDLDSPFFMEHSQMTEKNLSIIRVVIQNIAKDIIQDQYIYHFLNLDRNLSVFLFTVKKNSSCEISVDTLKEFMEKLAVILSEKIQVNINSGISLVHSGIINLPKCLDEAKKAAELSKKGQAYEVVCFGKDYDISKDYYFSEEVEYQLISYLKNGSYRESKDLLNYIFNINSSSENMSSKEALPSLLYDITSTLLHVVNSILSSKDQPLISCESFLGELLAKHPSMNEAKHFFINYINEIADLSETRIISKTEQLVNNIVEFIDANAGNKWVDLNSLSKEFKITPQYISNIFKKYKQENIKDYIAKIRLNSAKELLVSTDMSIFDISVSIGYVNELGVFRLFRKYENTTPGEYRILHKNK